MELGGYWDAANEIPAPNSRTLYTSLYSTGRPSTIPSAPVSFTTSLTTGDLNFPTLGITTSVISQYGVAGSTSGITTLNGLRSAIVRYVRGCNFSSSSTCTDRGDGKKLWDIFHSNPLVVGPPNAGLNALSYREFVDKYGHRKRVIYAGSNGGFVHGFNAGEWDSVAGEYNRGTGAEQFGFMAWPARKTIANLPRDVSRTWYYMDGSPQAADVWLYPDPEVQPGDATAWND